MTELPKPATVEIGQWYVYCNGSPWRVEPYTTITGSALSLYADEKTRYLGNGEHPAPSDKMVDALVDAMSEIENGAPVRHQSEHAFYRAVVLDALANRCGDLSRSRCISVIYRLLCARGEW